MWLRLQPESFLCQSLCFAPETFLKKWEEDSEDFFNLCSKVKRPGKQPDGKSMLMVDPKWLPGILTGHQYVTTNVQAPETNFKVKKKKKS